MLGADREIDEAMEHTHRLCQIVLNDRCWAVTDRSARAVTIRSRTLLPSSSLPGNVNSIKLTENHVTLTSDIVRSTPLFYGKEGTRYIVTDDPRIFTTKKLNQSQLIPFLAFGYTMGADTMIDSVRQVQAGEQVEISSTGVSQTTYAFFRRPSQGVAIAIR
jgi:hypothetical protein